MGKAGLRTLIKYHTSIYVTILSYISTQYECFQILYMNFLSYVGHLVYILLAFSYIYAVYNINMYLQDSVFYNIENIY